LKCVYFTSFYDFSIGILKFWYWCWIFGNVPISVVFFNGLWFTNIFLNLTLIILKKINNSKWVQLYITLCDFFFFKCSQFFPKSRKLTTFGMLCFTCLRKQEYLYNPKMWCKFRCLNYRYQSDILILNEKWHQCEQSIVISEQIIIQQYIIVLILN
jgi:hypothetical protein